MIGPVLFLDLWQSSRRGTQWLFRLLYGGWLAVQYFVVYLLMMGHDFHDRGSAAEFLQTFLSLFIAQQFYLLLAVLPTFAAGTITDEKTRGTLQLLMTAHLTATEIILGKLLGQLMRMVDLALVGLPFFALVGSLAGIDWKILLAVYLGMIPPLVAVGAASLLASVWCRTTNEAVLSVYLVGMAGIGLVAWLTGLGAWFGPFYVLASTDGEPNLTNLSRHVLHAWLAWGSLTVPCLGLAIWRLRPAYLRQLSAGKPRSYGRWIERPPVTDLPLRWKERYLGGLSAVPLFRRVPRWVGIGVVFLFSGLVSIIILVGHLPSNSRLIDVLRMLVQGNITGLTEVLGRRAPAHAAFQMLGLGMLFLAGLLVAIRCAAAVTQEREKQTWEALLLTPLETKQLLRGKLWGIIDSAALCLFAFAIPACLLAGLDGLWSLTWIVFGWLATWPMVYFLGACGIECSVRSPSSWRSLLRTLTSGSRMILQSFLLGLPLTIVLIAILGFVLHALSLLVKLVTGLSLFDGATGSSLWSYQVIVLLSILLTMIALFGKAEILLESAEKQVAEQERIPQGGLSSVSDSAVRK